jgi:tetratricopeptide (TPR) repeat protein
MSHKVYAVDENQGVSTNHGRKRDDKMDTVIIVAIITGAFGIIIAYIQNRATASGKEKTAKDENSPTASTVMPEISPVVSPTISPVISPEISPVISPTISPVISPEIKVVLSQASVSEPTTPLHKYKTQPPPLVGEFICREDSFSELYMAIKDNKNNNKLALINGLGGIGKTTVAKALCHKMKDEGTGVFWVEYQESLNESLLNAFKRTDGAEENDRDARLSNIKEFLEGLTQNEIIFIDDVAHENEMDFASRLNAKVVLTSRLEKIRHFNKFTIDFLTQEQCVQLFYKYYDYEKYDKEQKDKETVNELVKLAACHTLSVELVALAANKPGSLKDYAAQLKEKGFAYPTLNVETEHNQNSTVIAQHLIKLFEMADINPEQKRILINFSIMPSQAIPAEVQAWLACDINDITALTKRGWLTALKAGYYMHPIIKEAIQLQHKAQYEDCEALIKYMSTGRREYIHDTMIYTEAHLRLSIAEAVMNHFVGVEKDEIGLLFNEIALVYDDRGDYPKALDWYHKDLAISEKVLGLEHESTATTYNNIAEVYRMQEDYPTALEWYQKALKIREKVLGKDHSDTATTYNNIALVHYRQGDYSAALKLYHKTLAIYEKVLGKEHPDTATTYNNIAAVYDNQGDYPTALEWYHKALNIKEKVLSKDNPSIATTYNNIAGVYDSQGDYPTALEGYQKALNIFEKVYGDEHPLTILVKKNIALTIAEMNNKKTGE